MTTSSVDDAVQVRASQLSQNSRFRLTYLHGEDLRGTQGLRWGLWNSPNIDMSQYYTYTLQIQDVGRLDRIAKQFFGDEKLWWAIAWVNQIHNVFSDTHAGMEIQIPLLSAVETALSEGNKALFD